MFIWKLGKCRISLETFLSMFSMGTSFGTTFRTTFPDIHYLLMIRKIPVFAGDTQYFNSFKTFPSMISYWYLHKIYQIWLKSCLKTTCFGDGGPFSKNFSIYHLITILWTLWGSIWCHWIALRDSGRLLGGLWSFVLQRQRSQNYSLNNCNLKNDGSGLASCSRVHCIFLVKKFCSCKTPWCCLWHLGGMWGSDFIWLSRDDSWRRTQRCSNIDVERGQWSCIEACSELSPSNRSRVTTLVGDGCLRLKVKCEHAPDKHAGRNCKSPITVGKKSNGWFMVCDPKSGRILGLQVIHEPENNQHVIQMLQTMVWLYPHLDCFVYGRACSLQPSASKVPDLQRIQRYVVDKFHAHGHSAKCLCNPRVLSTCLYFKCFPCLHISVLVVITWGSEQITNLHGGVQVFIIFLDHILADQ